MVARSFRIRRRAARGAWVAAALLAMAFSGCVGELETYYGFDPDVQYINPGVLPGSYVPSEGSGSSVLRTGTLPFSRSAEVFYLRSALDGEFIPVAVWRPYGGLVEGGVPIIVDAGPYFELYRTDSEGNPDPLTIDRPSQRGEFFLANFVPHGYAYAQVAVRGTGTHGGCMELMSQAEARDISQAVSFLAEEPWSNGKVAMIGASYDGSTPWMVAAQGNPHLKAIVPVSGLPDIFDLMFHNGTAETRGPIMHSVVYWPFGFNRNPLLPFGAANGERERYQEVANLACPEMAKGTAMGPWATAMGGRDPEAVGYWRERDYRDAVVANYEGSVFLIHGLQDWNVDPHAAIPFNQRLKDAGIEVKEWYGQWGHAYPDSQCPKEYPTWLWAACRLDWAEVLLRYFEATLKDVPADHGPMLQVQSNYGHWRNAESYPPQAARWVELYPTLDGRLEEAPGPAASAILLPPGGAQPANYLEFRTEPLAEDTWISGLPQFPVRFEAKGPGGFLGVWLFDEDEQGKVLGRCFWSPVSYQASCFPAVVGHAQMDLRLREGGYEPQPVVPGVADVARLQLEPLELFVPKGHRLTVWLFQWQYSDHMSGPVPSPVEVFLGGSDASVLRLPVVDVDPTTVFPVPGSHEPKREHFAKFRVAKPVFDQVVEPIQAARAAQAACLDRVRAPAPVGPVGLVAVGPDPCLHPWLGRGPDALARPELAETRNR